MTLTLTPDPDPDPNPNPDPNPKAGAQLEATFRLGRPEAGYSPGPRQSVRSGEGGAALTGADARAVLAANREAWEEVLEWRG